MDSRQTSLQIPLISFLLNTHTQKLNQLPMDTEKLMLFHFLSHICACTHTCCYTFTCTNRHTHAHAHVAHTQTCTCTCSHMYIWLARLVSWRIWRHSRRVHDMHTVKIHRPGVYQTSVGCLNMTVTMIKLLIIIVDKLILLDYTTSSYSVKETMSYYYFEKYLNIPVNIFIQPIVEVLSNYQRFQDCRSEDQA